MVEYFGEEFSREEEERRGVGGVRQGAAIY
jgi:hypothetical protein